MSGENYTQYIHVAVGVITRKPKCVAFIYIAKYQLFCLAVGKVYAFNIIIHSLRDHDVDRASELAVSGKRKRPEALLQMLEQENTGAMETAESLYLRRRK